MYYLRKESYEQVIPEIKKTDGTLIPSRKYMTGDRALYKLNGMSRFYRKPYPNSNEKGMKLYKVKKLSTILEQRNALYKYCGEWFDVYNDNGKVDISNIVKCKKGFSIEKCDDNGFTIPNKYYTINEGEVWSIDKDERNKFLGGEIRLTKDIKRGFSWMEISKETLEEHFQKVN